MELRKGDYAYTRTQYIEFNLKYGGVKPIPNYDSLTCLVLGAAFYMEIEWFTKLHVYWMVCKVTCFKIIGSDYYYFTLETNMIIYLFPQKNILSFLSLA